MKLYTILFKTLLVWPWPEQLYWLCNSTGSASSA